MKKSIILICFLSIFCSCAGGGKIEKNDAAKEFNEYDINNISKLANLYMKQGDYLLAQKYYFKIISKHPNHCEANYQLGIISYKLGRTENSEKSFLTTLKLNPDHAKSSYNLAVIYSSSGHKYENLDRAALFFKKYLHLKPNSEHKYKIIDWLSERRIKKELSTEDLTKIRTWITTNEKTPEYVLNKNKHYKKIKQKANHKTLANRYYDKGMLNKAKKHFRLYLSTKSNDIESNYKLGVIFYKQGLIKQSRRYFAETVRFDKGNYYCKSLYFLGLIHSQKSPLYNSKKAVAYFEKYLALVPSTKYKKVIQRYFSKMKGKKEIPRKTQSTLKQKDEKKSYKEWLLEQSDLLANE